MQRFCSETKIQRGCDVNTEVADQKTPLHCTVLLDWVEVTEMLLVKGAVVNPYVHDGLALTLTPLMMACEEGLMDHILMLLAYGADAMVMTNRDMSCVDMLLWHEDRAVQDLVVNILDLSYDSINYVTLMLVAKRRELPFFAKLVKNIRKIRLRYVNDLITWNPVNVKSEYFKLIVDKFSSFYEELIADFGTKIFFNIPQWVSRWFVENFCTLLDHPLLGCLIIENLEETQHYSVILAVMESDFHFVEAQPEAKLEGLTKLVCCLLSHGVDILREEVRYIFHFFGYCELFKILLHMDVDSQPCWFFMDVIPQIIYDVNITIEQFLANGINHYSSLHNLLDYFALPTVKRHCLKLDIKGITARIKQQPDIPSLVELARNCARAFIIKKYNVKNSRQFYTVLEWLPIAKIHKQIIAFEKKLYEATEEMEG